MNVEALSWSLAQAPRVQPQCVAVFLVLANHADVLVRGVDVLGVVHVPAGCHLRSCRGATELAKEIVPARDKVEGNGAEPAGRWPFVLTESFPLVERPSRCLAARQAEPHVDGRLSAVQIVDRSARLGNARWSHVRAASVAAGRCRRVSAAVVGSVTVWLRLSAFGSVVAVADDR